MIKSASRSSITNDQKYRSMLAGTVPSSEYLIESRVLDSNVNTITFHNLAQFAGIYKHFKIVWSARSIRISPGGSLLMRINNDSGNNYSNHFLHTDGSTVYSFAQNSASRMTASSGLVGGTSASGLFCSGVIDILDWSGNKNKTLRTLHGSGTTATSSGLSSGLWMNTGAVTSISLIEGDSSQFETGSRFSLYGVTI